MKSGIHALQAARRPLAIAAVLVPLVALLVYVALRSGPLAPVAVTVTRIESRSLSPALFGIGTIEARYTYRVGPTYPGRVKAVTVHVGDRVKAGQVLGEMDPVDLDDHVRAQQAQVARGAASVQEASARLEYARAQASRYDRLYASRLVSEEALNARQQEFQATAAAAAAAREDLARAQSDLDAARATRGALRLIAPVDGIVTARNADPGTTVVAGQAVVEMIDPQSLWVDVRLDQVGAAGLKAGLPARIALRSRNGEALAGSVLWLEPKADAVTEELLAKVVFDQVPAQLPPLGELAEVTVGLPSLPNAPVIRSAAVHRRDGRPGVWKLGEDGLVFAPVQLGRSDLDGNVQVLDGIAAGDRVVLYSEKALSERSRVRLVERLPGA